MLFGQEFMSGTTLVRVVALTGKKGQPPLLWEGEPSTDTETVIRQISRNKQIVEWLYKSGRVRQRVATVNLQVQEYAGRKRIASHAIPGYSFIVRGRRRGRNIGEQIVLRSFDMVERILELMVHLVHERDTVVGRVAEVGIRSLSTPPASPPASAAPSDALAQILESMPKLMEMAESFRRSRRADPSTD